MVMRHRPDRGFVMLDVLAATILFMGGVLLAATFFRNEVRALRTTHERAAAVFAAESEMERLVAQPFDALDAGETKPMDLTTPGARSLKEARGELTVRELAPGLKEATVRLVWKTPKRHDLHVSLTRRFARKGRP